MHRILNGVFLLLLSCSLGLHWAALQGVAWTMMLVERVPVSGWCKAMESTFDGSHPCRLCQTVRKGHAESRSAEVAGGETRAELIASATTPLLLSHPPFALAFPAIYVEWDRRPVGPYVPPPRNSAS